MRKVILFSLIIVATVAAFGQNSENNSGSSTKYKITTVAFWNVENLWDTINDPNSWGDNEFLPNSPKHWNTKKYDIKINHLTKVISMLGTPADPNGPAVIGLAEVENKRVLESLVNAPNIKNRHYKIVHFESPDHRGIDVALLYEPSQFKLISAKPFHLYVHGKLFHTRDQLLVSGILDGEKIHIIVAHWPSRYGGEKRSLPYRNAAAELGRHLIDSLQKASPNSKIIYMGDLNDDPVSPSVKKYLGSVGKLKNMNDTTMFNPMWQLYKKGIGTLAYHNTWDLFDQIMMNKPLMQKDYNSFEYYKALVFNKSFMIQSRGAYKGYPFRTFVGDTFLGGYSDHFPVLVYLIKKDK